MLSDQSAIELGIKKKKTEKVLKRKKIKSPYHMFGN